MAQTRRDFVKTTGIAAAGAAVVPSLLTSEKLFAQGSNRSAQHVVLVMFAGGVRHQESIDQRYLADAQAGQTQEGNLMYNMLTGAAPTGSILYGTGSGGSIEIPSILSNSIQSQGTLFSEVNALSTGHYIGLNSILQGGLPASQGLRMRPISPTIFEYVRKHGGYNASDVWFVGNTVQSSIPLLNYSDHPDYGIKYGANFFAPTVTFHPTAQNYLAHGKTYNHETEWSPMMELKAFLDYNFSMSGAMLDALGNTEEEKENIKLFMNQMVVKTNSGTLDLPPVHDNADTYTMGYAVEVLKYFQPSFMCVNLNAVDVAHSNFSQSMQALHRADHAVGHLWNVIQNTPGLAGNTTLICIPECGRNDEPNSIADANGFLSYDHSDLNSRRIFSLIAGPNVPSNLVIGSEGNSIGQVSDAMMTVADILGVKQAVLDAGMVDPNAHSFFDLI